MREAQERERTAIEAAAKLAGKLEALETVAPAPAKKSPATSRRRTTKTTPKEARQ